MKSSILLCFAMLFVASTDSGLDNFRPFISTSLAKTIMTNGDEEVIVEDKCDGSGWITHGDGHKTECPGCSNCETNNPKPDPKPDPEVTYTCKCNTSRTYCNCVAAYGKCSCRKIEVKKKDLEYSEQFLEPIKSEPEKPKYRIYHFGAKWCPPCIAMKEKTWKDADVKNAIKTQNAKLFILDEAHPPHLEYFKHYKVKVYPTIIFVAVDSLEKQIYRTTGFVDAEEMRSTIQKELTNE